MMDHSRSTREFLAEQLRRDPESYKEAIDALIEYSIECVGSVGDTKRRLAWLEMCKTLTTLETQYEEFP